MKSVTFPATIIGVVVFVLSLPSTCRSVDAEFDNKVKAIGILTSIEMVGEVANCLSGEQLRPQSLTLEIEVGPDGSARVVNVYPGVLPGTLQCLNDLLGGKPMPASEAGYNFTQRLAFPPHGVAELDGEGHPARESAPAAEVEKEAPAPEVAWEVSGIRDPDAGRIVYFPTAIPRPKGTINATAHDIGYWQLEYGLTDQIALSTQLLLPITVVSLAPGMRMGFRLSDNLWLGGNITAGFFIPYIDDVDAQLVFYGGGASLTVGGDAFVFSAGLEAFGATLFADMEGSDSETEALLLPHLGMSVRLSSMVRFNLEVTPPLVPTVSGASDAELWLILYGIRIHGEMLYGDISFVWPAFEDAWEFMKYMPMGMPLLSFGFHI